MCEITKLLRLLQAVPILAVDEASARARGDHEAVRYARAVERWQADAARALEEADQEPAQRPSAFERILAAAERSRPSAASLSDAAGIT